MAGDKFYIDEMEDQYIIDQFEEALFKKLCTMTNARIEIKFKDDDLIVKLVMYGFVSTMTYPGIKERLRLDFPVEEISENVMTRFQAHVDSAFFKKKTPKVIINEGGVTVG